MAGINIQDPILSIAIKRLMKYGIIYTENTVVKVGIKAKALTEK